MVTTPPPDATVPERHPGAPAPGYVIESHYELCFGCGARHPTGLHMVVTAGEGLTVRGVFTVSAFDDVLGTLNWLLQTPAVTARLEVDFRRPVPVDSVLYLDAEIISTLGRKVYTRGVGRLDAPDGRVALTAAALFIQVDLSHFRDHGRPEDLDQAMRDGQVRGALERLELNP